MHQFISVHSVRTPPVFGLVVSNYMWIPPEFLTSRIEKTELRIIFPCVVSWISEVLKTVDTRYDREERKGRLEGGKGGEGRGYTQDYTWIDVTDQSWCTESQSCNQNQSCTVTNWKIVNWLTNSNITLMCILSHHSWDASEKTIQQLLLHYYYYYYY